MTKIAIVLLALCLAGCCNTFYTHVDGENDMIGIRLPVESDIQIDISHHINGSTMTVKDKSRIEHEYSVTNSNSYFGCISVNEVRHGKIIVDPNQTTTNEVTK